MLHLFLKASEHVHGCGLEYKVLCVPAPTTWELWDSGMSLDLIESQFPAP